MSGSRSPNIGWPAAPRGAARRAIAAALVLIAVGIAAMAPGGPAPIRPLPLAVPDTFPAGHGREIAERACLVCHSPMLITQQAKDSTGWEKTLGLMTQWGAPLSAAEHDTLRGYLLEHFGPRPPVMKK